MSVTRYFLILSLAVLGQVAVSADQGAVVTGDRVNVRSDISTNADIIEKATKGAKYIAVERDTINPPIEGMPANWIKVRLNSSPVYIKSDLLNEDGTAKTNLNLREGPGTTYKKVGQLKQGEKVVVLGTENGWTKVEGPEAFGYIAEDYIQLTGPVEKSSAPEVKNEKTEKPTPEKTAASAITIKPAEAKPVQKEEPKTEPAPTEKETPEVVDVQAEEPTPVIIPPEPAAPAIQTAQPAVEKNVAPEAENPAEEVDAEQTEKKQIVIVPISTQTNNIAGTEETTGNIKRREGIVRLNESPAAPTPYSLYNIYDRRMMNFLYITKDNEISLKPYSGKKVIVTGPESIDPRWKNHPLLTVKTIELRNK
ncbi:MAG: SH3 domain-containing protein [Verrucomicrobia bacterium]|nr:SH3 domain-containing protein [Verrucomicrobiota bacterium]